MEDLSSLKEKYKSYVNEKAEEIINKMVSYSATSWTSSSCDAPNWDREYHRAMPDIIKRLKELGITTATTVKWGVTDYVFTLK
jgi:DUF438 domain-containing protein